MTLPQATVKGKLGEIRTRGEVGLAGRSRIIWNACPDCGYERWSLLSLYEKNGGKIYCVYCTGKTAVNYMRGKDHKGDCQCWKCKTKNQLGENNHAWNGGFSYVDGYKTLKIYEDDPNYSMADSRGYAMEHRLVMAQALGRPLAVGETVHHINGIKDDNRIDNLELWYTNHGHGVRVKDLLNDWAKLYDYHCPGCKCEVENE